MSREPATVDIYLTADAAAVRAAVDAARALPHPDLAAAQADREQLMREARHYCRVHGVTDSGSTLDVVAQTIAPLLGRLMTAQTAYLAVNADLNAARADKAMLWGQLQQSRRHVDAARAEVVALRAANAQLTAELAEARTNIADCVSIITGLDAEVEEAERAARYNQWLHRPRISDYLPTTSDNARTTAEQGDERADEEKIHP